MQVGDTFSRLSLSGRVGRGGLPRSLPGRAVTWDRLFTVLLLLPSQPCGILLPAFLLHGQGCGGLTPAQGTDGFSKVHASRGLPSACKSATPTSSEILILLLGTQRALCLSPAPRMFVLLYFIGFPCQLEDRRS